MVLQRYVIIVATAFGGAWTMIVGALALAGARDVAKARRPATSGFSIRCRRRRAAVGPGRLDRARPGRHGRAAGCHGKKTVT